MPIVSDFAFTKKTLPDHRSLNSSHIQQLVSIYDRALLATPAQKRHRVDPAELVRLDKLRYTDIPERVRERGRRIEAKEEDEKDEGDVGTNNVNANGSISSNSSNNNINDYYLTASELQDLMAWKLARGVWRPGLAGRIAANSDTTVQKVTREAFGLYRPHRQSQHPEEDEGRKGGKEGEEEEEATETTNSRSALDKLCELGGVGPATASLLLAVAFPADAPFFSDEIYYFYAAGESRRRLEKIRYSAAEYLFVEGCLRKTQQRQQQQNQDGGSKIRADDVERATFVVQKLHNPDIWEAALAEEDPAAAIRHRMDEKDESMREDGGTNGFNPSKNGANKSNKEIAKKAPMNRKRGSRDESDRNTKRRQSDTAKETPRRSLRTSKRLDR